MTATAEAQLQTTPLAALHESLGGRMVPFAGYAMPVQYGAGIIAEHLHTRKAASLFDVSHMGQVIIGGDGVDQALEKLAPADLTGLGDGRLRYTMLTNAAGGIIDDLMIGRLDGAMRLVLNAGRKEVDLAHLEARLPGYEITHLTDRALLALQGPDAAAVLARLVPGVEALRFMALGRFVFQSAELIISRSGYTGEDGFELSVPADQADALARALLDQAEIAPAGLGARDSLRLEAGLCLYGADIDETTSPVEAGLSWTIAKRRRADGDFLGADTILAQLRDGAARRLVGLLPEGKAPARAHTVIMDGAAPVGEVTSGGFGPSVGGPIAMGYVDAARATPGQALSLMVRGTPRPAHVAKLPFAPHRYAKAR